jgi:hypothetical protein
MNSSPATRSLDDLGLPGRLFSPDGLHVCDVRYTMHNLDSRGRLRPHLGDLLPPTGANLTLALTDGRLLKIVVTKSRAADLEEPVAGFVVLRITH